MLELDESAVHRVDEPPEPDAAAAYVALQATPRTLSRDPASERSTIGLWFPTCTADVSTVPLLSPQAFFNINVSRQGRPTVPDHEQPE